MIQKTNDLRHAACGLPQENYGIRTAMADMQFLMAGLVVIGQDSCTSLL